MRMKVVMAFALLWLFLFVEFQNAMGGGLYQAKSLYYLPGSLVVSLLVSLLSFGLVLGLLKLYQSAKKHQSGVATVHG